MALTTLLAVSSIFLLLLEPSMAAGSSRHPADLVEQPQTILKYHGGALLYGHLTVNILWYGKFSPAQRAILVDFLLSLNSGKTPAPAASTWWQIIYRYRGGPRVLSLGNQIFDEKCSLGKNLNDTQLVKLGSRLSRVKNDINIVFTSSEVGVADFCMNRCGSHGEVQTGKERAVYLWVGNPATQCPGQCAWPFVKPIVGPQTPPLVPPNGDVGIDGMVINLATVLAGVVTNPYDDGYYQGPADASLEAVSACTGIFGKGAFPGYPGELLVDKRSGTSYNANGAQGRKYLVPAMWDPKSKTCKSLV